MTNPTNSSPNPLRPIPKTLRLQQVERLVEASPFRAFLKLPPEEVLDCLHNRVVQALLQGLQEVKRRELEGLMSSKATPDMIVGEMYEVRGLVSLADTVLTLEQQVITIRDAYKRET
jgi:hypothetical protein